MTRPTSNSDQHGDNNNINIKIGPSFHASSTDMDNLPLYISTLLPILSKNGCVCIIPPATWTKPVNPVTDETKITEMGQTFPQPPFANSDVISKMATTSRNVQQIQDIQGRVSSNIEFGNPRETNVRKFKRRTTTVLNATDCKCVHDKLVSDNSDLTSLTEMEKRFWDMAENGISGKPFTVYYGNDVYLKDLNDVEDERTDSSPRKKWASSNINEGGCLRHMYTIPGITSSFFYMGNTFTYFGIHCEDEDLYSVAYLHTGLPKFWYVYRPADKAQLERYSSRYIFSPNYLNEHMGGARQVFQKKTVLINPLRSNKDSFNIPLSRIVQLPGTFVVTAPMAYHFGFNCGLNVAETVNYGDGSWLKIGRAAAKIRTSHRSDGTVSLPWELVSWKEALRFIGVFRSPSIISSQEHNNACHVWRELDIFFRRADRLISHRKQMKYGTVLDLSERFVSGWDENYPELLCDECNHPTFLFVEICSDCEDVVLARCINHLSPSPRKFCHVHGHRSIIVRRYSPSVVGETLSTLKSLTNIMSTSASKRTIRCLTNEKETTDSESNKRSKRRLARYKRRTKQKSRVDGQDTNNIGSEKHI